MQPLMVMLCAVALVGILSMGSAQAAGSSDKQRTHSESGTTEDKGESDEESEEEGEDADENSDLDEILEDETEEAQDEMFM